jgi:hypothetical protein
MAGALSACLAIAKSVCFLQGGRGGRGEPALRAEFPMSADLAVAATHHVYRLTVMEFGAMTLRDLMVWAGPPQSLYLL